MKLHNNQKGVAFHCQDVLGILYHALGYDHHCVHGPQKFDLCPNNIHNPMGSPMVPPFGGVKPYLLVQNRCYQTCSVMYELHTWKGRVLPSQNWKNKTWVKDLT